MTLAVLVIVSASTVLLLLLYGATVELYRQVLQLRLHAGLTDEARPLEFNRDARLSHLSIPAVPAGDAASDDVSGDGATRSGDSADWGIRGDRAVDRGGRVHTDGADGGDGEAGNDRDTDGDQHAGSVGRRRFRRLGHPGTEREDADDGSSEPASGGHQRRHAVLILSDSCTTCAEVARGLDGEPAPGLVVLVESRSAATATAWLRAQGLTADNRVIYDEAGRLADRLGVAVTPAVVRFEDDRATAASTVPSGRQLDAVTAWLRDAEVRLPTGTP